MPDQPAIAKSVRGRHKQPQRRKSIMAAAERLFTTRRFHEITMDSVAAEAGVAKGTLYSYFQDKDDLFFQTATGGLEELCEVIRTKVPREAPLAERLLRVTGEISRFFDRRGPLLRLMQTEEARSSQHGGSLRARWVQERTKLLLALAGIFADGQGRGEVRADLPPQVLAAMLLGMLRARAHDLSDAPPAWRTLELIVDFFLNGSAAVEKK